MPYLWDEHNVSVIYITVIYSIIEEIQKIMQNTLQQYCGLMAKQLIISIAQAQSIEDIRLYQSKWLTTLFESRINRQELNQLLFIRRCYWWTLLTR